MKKIIIISLIIFEMVATVKLSFARNISISDAIKSKLISVKVKANGGLGSECLNLKITNLKNRKINIDVEAGRMFIPNDSNVQNLILVKHEVFEINPNQTINKNLNVLCAQKHDNGPSKDLIFKTGNFAIGQPKLFAEWVDKKEYFTSDNVQSAMWVLTDNSEPSFSIYNEKDKEMLAFVAKAKNWNYDKLLAKFTTTELPKIVEPARPKFIFSSTLTFTISEPQTLRIVLCDKNNQVVQECLKSEILPIGTNVKHIDITNDNFENGKYYLKIFVNDKMIRRREILIN
ncbi:MAG: hypothetical protein ACOYMA_18255 [Bacteroidia bacterium]